MKSPILLLHSILNLRIILTNISNHTKSTSLMEFRFKVTMNILLLITYLTVSIRGLRREDTYWSSWNLISELVILLNLRLSIQDFFHLRVQGQIYQFWFPDLRCLQHFLLKIVLVIPKSLEGAKRLPFSFLFILLIDWEILSLILTLLIIASEKHFVAAVFGHMPWFFDLRVSDRMLMTLWLWRHFSLSNLIA